MAQSITIQSFNQILGGMIRSIIAETPLNDLNAGSVLLTLLEACAAQDFENNTAILNILELLNIDAVQNSDLDDRAADYGLTRNPAIAASGLVNILNNNIVKQSSGLYVLKPTPIAGQTVIYLNNTTGWTPTGTVYIGRGTQSFEGPIPYTSITVFPTYSQMNLGSALQRDHLLSDSVVNSQGQPDYNIAAGTVVNIPANNQKPEVQYQTLVDAVIPAGETIASNVTVIALVAGSQGNAGIHTITSFDTPPFTGAGVINTGSFSNGVDQETDTQLRNRIKNYATTLARGTALSIVDAVIGVSDPIDSLQVASAVIQEPATVGLPAILYIDDGYGLQPTFQGQSVDTLVTNATGTESFLQLANFPLPRPQVINTVSGPFNVASGSFLRVIVDGVQEDITFLNSNFQNPAAATLAEIIIVINTNSKLINARYVDNSQFLLIYPIAPDAEIIQVAPISTSDNPLLYLNSLLLFPTNEFSFISLFRNATRLHEQAHSATVETIPFGLWNIASTQDLLLSVDNTPAQDQTFPISNFVGASSFAALTLPDWVTAFNQQFAGITATATASQTMLISSNKVGNTSALNVEGGSLLTKLFPGKVVTSVGQSSDFALNRQTGNLDVFTINAGDNISAGIVDAKGFDISAKTISGTYNLDADSAGRPAEMVVVADSTVCDQVSIPLLIGSTLAISNHPTIANPPTSYSFTVTSANATVGAVYSNNGETFTVSTTIVAGTTLVTTVVPSMLTPLPSGTLTLVSGTGDATITFSTFVASGSVMRIMSSTLSAFQALAPGDFIYIVSRTTGWLDPANTGLFRIIDRGANITAGTDSFIDVLNATIVPQGSVTVQDSTDIQGFKTDGFPQIWRGEYVINPAAALITDIVKSLNTDLLNVKASIYNTTAIKITSTTERGGSIAVPVVTPQMSTLFASTQHAQLGNPPLLANLVSSKDLVSSFKRTTPVTGPLAVWLGRYTYSDVKGSIDTNNTPDSYPFAATYGEIISSPQLSPSNVSYDDYVSFTLGQNRDQFKSVKAIGPGGGLLLNSIGTQQGTARSELDYIVGDTFDLIRPIQLSPADTIVFIMDKNPTSNTINIPMTRLGQVNGGNGTGPNYIGGDATTGSFPPTSTEFSANDAGNQPGIDFGNTVVWGTAVNNTNFSDYDVWMQARNWYISGGVGSGRGTLILRAAQFGPNGENINFSIAYPSTATATATTTYLNSSSLSQYTYFFGSGAARAIALPANTTIVVTHSAGNFWNYTFSGGALTSVQVNDVLSILPGSGISTPNSGQLQVSAKTNLTLTVYNATGVASPIAATFTATFGASVGTITPSSMAGLAVGQVLNDTTLGTNLAPGTYITGIGVSTFTISSPTVAASGGADTITATTPEVVTNLGLISVYPLIGTAASAIAGTINAGLIMTATPVGNPALTITAATSNESSSTVANGYTPGNASIALYDSVAWVKTFANSNPNFVLKNTLVLQGAQPTIYSMDTAPNVDGTLGEYFNLLPSTIKNIYHHFTQPALSQLPIVANIAITNDRKNVQIDSLQLGSAGAIEVVGGNANKSQAYILNESDVVTDTISGPPVSGFALLAATAITNTGASNITGNVGVAPGTSITPGGWTLIGTSHSNDAQAIATQAAALAAYTAMFGETATPISATLDGQTLTPGVYNTGAATLDAGGPLTFDGAGVYVIQVASTLITGGTGVPVMVLTGGATASNIFWTVGSSATINSSFTGVFQGNVTAQASIVMSVGTGVVYGNLVALTGAITISAPTYVVASTSTSVTTSSLQLITPAFPDTYNVGDFVLLQNDSGVRRLSRLSAADNINVTVPSSNHANYNYDPKATLIGAGTTFTITDVSSTYGRAAGFVWRWTFGAGPTVAAVNPGDLLMAFGPSLLADGWQQGNLARVAGDGEIAGLPIVAVNDTTGYIDVVNPYGVAMSATPVGAGNTVQICPAPAIRWNLAHAANVQISTMSRVSNVITVTTSSPHFLESTDSVNITDSLTIPDGTYTGIVVDSITQFHFTLVGSNFAESSVGATAIKTGVTPTRYKVEKLGFNGMMRIEWFDGASPMFADSGVAVDDYVIFGGSTFQGNNNGIFRVTSVDNNSIMIVNSAGSDQLNTILPFNNNGFLASWAANSNLVTGVAGTFKNLAVGDWVRKTGDGDELFLQVTGFIPSTPSAATTISLGGNYAGTTGTSSGVFWNELTGYNTGIYLQNADDLAVYEGDAAMVGDLLSVQNIINPAWFNVANIGNFPITSVGTDPVTYKPFVQVVNPAALAEINRSMSVNTAGFYITESDANKYYSVRQVSHVALNDVNSANRDIYVKPDDRAYKFSNANATSILSQGKLGYSTEVTTGIDGYLYYTGLLQVVQRLVDGFEPDQTDYPGLRAVGGLIETLPPLVNTIKISINVATNNGVNLGDITDSIQSVIIDYVQGLGVGQDVILSEIIAQVMNITGVAAVTFTNPAPSTERITIAFNERANITPANIGIANG